MPITCLPKELADNIKQAIKRGGISPDKLKAMTSVERRSFLSEIVGEDASKQINLLFERKVLLKNQERAMYDWARDVTNISKAQKEEMLIKIRKTYADKQRRLYEPAENEKFLDELTADIFSKKYRTDVSLAEANQITKLTSKMKEFKSKMNAENVFENTQDGINYGAAKVALRNYVGNLKLEAKTKWLTSPFKVKGIGEKLKTTEENLGIAFNFIAENARAIKASVDNSWWLRQGWKTLFNPRYTAKWIKNFVKSFDDIYKSFKGKGDDVMNGLEAEIYARPNSTKGLYENKGGIRLDIGTGEEAFPTSAPAKIPILGRVFKASETAYEAAAMRMRADIADISYAAAERAGVDLGDKFRVGEINKFVNALTGRGRLPVAEGTQSFLNKVFFSVKLWKSNIDLLTMPFNPRTDAFVRKEAAISLLSTIAGSATLMGIANKLWPGSVDPNPLSANFGKIKIGNTRFDVTGGMGSMITLITRQIQNKSKSAVTGITNKFGEGFDPATRYSVLLDFTENKLSPMFSVIKSIAEGRTFGGEKTTLGTVAQGLTVPIIGENYLELADDPNSANVVLAMIADSLGMSTNTYTYKTNWETSTSKELKQFKAVKGDEIFKEANDKYNLMMNNFLSNVIKEPDWELMTKKEKQNLISEIRDDYKESIFKEYEFEYTKGIPQFNDGEEVDNKTIIQAIVLYAEAIGKDPVNAFKVMFNDQTLRRTDNDAVIVERMSEEDRVVQKKKAGYTFGSSDDAILDHIIPLQLGGDNKEDNLQLIPREEWASYTPVENYLGSQLRQGIIDRKTAQKLIKDMKLGLRTPESILNMKF